MVGDLSRIAPHIGSRSGCIDVIGDEPGELAFQRYNQVQFIHRHLALGQYPALMQDDEIVVRTDLVE